MGTKFAPICDGMSGDIRNLEICETFVDGHMDLPIDTLVIDLTKERVEGDDIGEVDKV